MKKNLKDKKSLNIAMLGHKRIPSREGGIEIVVEELATRIRCAILIRSAFFICSISSHNLKIPLCLILYAY